MKHLRSNIANITQELSKVTDAVNPAAFYELLCVLKYVLDMKYFGLKLEPSEHAIKPWNSTFAGDPISRSSMREFMLYVFGVLVSWELKVKRSMTLSSSEAEWVPLREAVNDVMFLIQLLRSMKILMKLPQKP